MIQKYLKKLILNALLLAFPFLLWAQSETSTYKITLENLQIGEVIFRHDQDKKIYRVMLDFKPKGLAGALFEASLFATTTGQGTEFGVYTPKFARMSFINNGKLTAQNMVYENAKLKSFITIPPQTQTAAGVQDKTIAPENNAVDPLTALTYILRPMPFEQLCAIRIHVDDGVRRGYLSLSEPTLRPDGRHQCKGGFESDLGAASPTQIGTDEVAKGTYYLNVLYRLDRNSGHYIVDRLIGKGSFGIFQMVPLRSDADKQKPAAAP